MSEKAVWTRHARLGVGATAFFACFGRRLVRNVGYDQLRMPVIEVEAGSSGEYIVSVQEGGGATVHRVKVDSGYALKLTGGRASTEELLLLSFEFLLEREPKESILRSFDLPLIGYYFPEN